MNHRIFNTERYATSYRFTRDDKRFIHCSRQRCNVTIDLIEDKHGARYPDSVVVVSIDGGRYQYGFCSDKCAALWLQAKDR